MIDMLPIHNTPMKSCNTFALIYSLKRDLNSL